MSGRNIDGDSRLEDLRLQAQIRGIVVAVLFFLVIPIAMLGAQQGFGYWQSAVVVALALFSIGVFLGFLFGVPKVAPPPTGTSIDQASAADRRRILDVNTNLEQISDWLTKIIVGLGLVELKEIPEAVQRFTAFIAGAFHESGTGPAAVGSTLYFPVLGFLGGYLLTRLYLASLISRADAQLGAVAKQARISALIGAATAAGQGSESDVSTAASAVRSAVARTPLSTFSGAAILWVDDNPRNNTYLIDAFRELGIRVDLAKSTDEALDLLAAKHDYDAIITDMNRGDDNRAGYTLLKALQAQNITTPVLIFSSSDSPEYRKAARDAGARDSTNRADRVFQFVTDIIGEKKQRESTGIRLPWPFGSA